jgi:hypothetical protein
MITLAAGERVPDQGDELALLPGLGLAASGA